MGFAQSEIAVYAVLFGAGRCRGGSYRKTFRNKQDELLRCLE